MKRRDSFPDRLSRSTIMRVGWWLLISITILNGLAAGYLAVGLSMTSSPGRRDYLMSAGAYGAACLALFAAAVAVKGLHGPRSAQWMAALVGAVLAILAGSSMSHAVRLPPSPAPLVSLQRGIEAVLFMPWSLTLLISSIPGAYYLWKGRRKNGDHYPQA